MARAQSARCESPDLSGTLVFAHANGFPAGTYAQLFKPWRAAGWRVCAPPLLAHDPRYPVTNNWPRLRDELAAFVIAQAPQGAHLVGHSMGGLLGLLLACRRPELVKGLVLLDSPVITGWRARSLHALKLSGLLQRVSPAKVSATRRHEWANRPEALAHFAAKSLFARWAPGVLDDYIACGTARRRGKTVLAFDRAVETRIYNSVPHHLGGLLQRQPPRCPVGLIAGQRSREMRLAGLGAARALAGERLRWTTGTHLFPMEQPALTAALVLELLAGMV